MLFIYLYINFRTAAESFKVLRSFVDPYQLRGFGPKARARAQGPGPRARAHVRGTHGHGLVYIYIYIYMPWPMAQ